MKKAALLFLSAICATQLSAQITLSASSYTSAVAGTTDTLMEVAISSLPAITTGPGQFWDFSGVSVDSTYYSAHTGVPSGPFSSTAQYTNALTDSLELYYYQLTGMSSITTNGITTYGAHIDQQKIWLSATFGAGSGVDTLTLLTQDLTYHAPTQYPIFPASYGATWMDTTTTSIQGILNVASLYTNAATVFSIYNSSLDTVTGWGTIKIRNSNGTISQMDALQVKSYLDFEQKTFVSGTQMGESEHDYTGLPRDYFNGCIRYRYYVANEVTPVMDILMNGAATTPAGATMLSKDFPPSAVNDVHVAGAITVYPNPVVARTLMVSLPESSNNWSYELISATGQLAAHNTLSKANPAGIQLSVAIVPGIYYLNILKGGIKVYTQKVTVE